MPSGRPFAFSGLCHIFVVNVLLEGTQGTEAIRVRDQVIRGENASRTHYHLGRVRLAQARFNEALTAFEHEVDEDERLAGLVLVQHARGRQAKSDAALTELIAKHSDGCAYQIAEGYAYRGEVDHAFNWLELAYTRRDPGLSFVKADPLLVRLRADLRWQSFLEKMGLAE